MATLSVIVPITRKKESRECLYSLQRQNIKGFNLEIVIICSHPEHYKDLPFFSSLTVVKCADKNLAHRRNLGTAESKGGFLAFLDDDTLVKPDWAANMVRHLCENKKTVVSGPNYDSRREFRYRLANKLQSHPLAEGLFSHRKMTVDVRRCKYNSVILANMGMHRELFTQIGGFNEKADHYMDDTEFCYISYNLGYDFLFFKDLSIHHNVRPIFWPFFRRQFRARFHAGTNCIVYPECYVNTLQVKIYTLSVILLILVMVFFNPLFWFILFGLYVFTLFIIGLSHIKDPLLMLCMPFCIALVHVNAYISFTLGILYGLYARYTVFKDAIAFKGIRYKVFSESKRSR